MIGRDSNQKPFPISRHFCQPMRWQWFYSWRQLMIKARARALLTLRPASAVSLVCLERRRREISKYKYPARWAWTSDLLFSDFWKYLNSNYNESIASNIIMKQFSETTKIKTTLILSTRTQLSDISSVQMKLFLVKLNFLNLKKVNIQSTKFNMVSKQQKYQYVFTPPPRCPRRSPRTTTIWRTRLAFPNNCRPGLLPQHLL